MDISMKELCSQNDLAWSWSESFLEIGDGWMQNPRPKKAAPQQRVRLACWLEQVDAARELYRQGQREALWGLYDYWRIIVEDVQEQARFASETYVSSTFLTALSNTQAGSSSRTATSSPSLLPES